MDLPLEGRLYTWSSFRDSLSMSRLNRFLISKGWEEHFPGMVQSCLPRVTSDHCPILLECGGSRDGCTPFRFENMWPKEVDFLGRVGDWWFGYEVEGNASIGWPSNWNREVLGNVRLTTTRLMEEVRRLDEKEGRVGLSEEEKRVREVKKGDIRNRLNQEEISWRQKSRALWLREVDLNSKFFHKVASAHKRGNHIGNI